MKGMLDLEKIRVYNIFIYRFINMDGLIEHLVKTHNQSINVVTKSFPNLHNFMQWKEELEITTSSLFVLHSSPKQ